MKLLIKNGVIIDGTGRPPQEGNVLVTDGVIAEVGPKAGGTGAADQVLDARNHYVVPGFINCHVHLSLNAGTHPMNDMAKADSYALTIQGVAVAAKLLRAGITTVRDMGSKHFEVLAIRDAIRQRRVPGPNIVASGQALLITGGHFSGLEVNGVDQCLAGARLQLHHGADFVKMMATGGLGKPDEIPGAQQLTYEELKACCDVARMAGKTSAAHAHGLEGIRDAVRAGVTSVEHATLVDETTADRMVEQGTYLVPTFAPYWLMVEEGKQKGVADYMIESSRWVMQEKMPRFRMALKKGVPIAFGTDAGSPINPHENLEAECRCLLDGGMTPMQVLVCLTQSGAKLLQLDSKLGTVEAGKQADIVLLQGNPLEDICQVARVTKVIKDGQIVC
jgi:imidazolonepropionase-like amidohydrolase